MDEQHHQGASISAHERRLQRFKDRKAGRRVASRAEAKAKAKPPPPIPGKLSYLFGMYQELRGANPRGFHVEPLSFTEIRAYLLLYRVDWDSVDVETLRGLDAVWLNCLPKRSPKDKS